MHKYGFAYLWNSIMVEPTSSAVTFLSVAKAWMVLASVFGSLIPILALSDTKEISFKQAVFMAVVGCSFAIFVGPWFASKIGFYSLDAIVALSWVMGASGVFIVRAVLKWLDRRGVSAIDRIFDKVVSNKETPLAGTEDTESKNRDL